MKFLIKKIKCGVEEIILIKRIFWEYVIVNGNFVILWISSRRDLVVITRKQ